MGKIRILSDNLVSKIAAGEIVERPASVVKELIENSIDAGATRVRIDLESGGKKLIKITDDGHGMARDEALLSLERHATSKISDIDDLFSVKTLGFRGEALPSIASVSRFVMTTKTHEDMIGTSITIDGGRMRKVEEAGCPAGTTIEVKRLFYNTPARLKFMRKTETETTNVLGVVERAAIANPDTAFSLKSEGRVLIDLPRRESWKDRVGDIYRNAHLYFISSGRGGVSVTGYISGPLDPRSSAQKIFTYVNSRAVKDRFITRMILDSYGKMLEKGKYPQGAIFIDIPHELVDVNVHPTKSEVRFKDIRLTGEVIKEAISGMLQRAPWVKSGDEQIERSVAGFMEKRGGTGAYEYPAPSGRYKYSDGICRGYADENDSRPTVHGMTELENTAPGFGHGITVAEADSAPILFQKEGFYSSLEVIGQIGDLYIVCSSPNGMVLVDQHAAHERINYEKIKNAYIEAKKPETQDLLVPETVEFSSYEASLLQSHMEDFKKLGLTVENFGDSTFIIRSVPAIFNVSGCSELLRDIVSEIAEKGREESLNEKLERVISTMACHSSVRASQRLNTEKMKALLAELDRMDFPHSCPHGRPVAREISFYEIEKMFKRT